MRWSAAVVMVVAAVSLGGVARADETTRCDAYITYLPYGITRQGHYCFDRNLSAPGVLTEAAVYIYSDYVVLDLNAFKLGRGTPPAGNELTAGVFVGANHKNVTIRNGNIRGFSFGIYAEGGNDNLVIENNLIDGSTRRGITLSDVGSAVIRDNRLTNTGADTFNVFTRIGIYVDGGFVSASGNVVGNVFSPIVDVSGMDLLTDTAVADHNIVTLGSAVGTRYGIRFGAHGVARDNTVLGASSAADAFVNADLVGANYSNP
jgi:parallel beta-helix repeat protein